MNKPIKAAIYVRVSSEKQVKQSGLAVQEAACRKYASEHGYEIFDVYRDEGISGAHGADDRKDLSRLLSDAKAREFKVLLVHELDRLARDFDVGMKIVGLVREQNVMLIEVSIGKTFTEEGALIGLVQLWAAGEDRKRILRRTKMGHIERAKKHLISGPAPLGYDKTPEGKLVKNPEEAALVRRIFNLFFEGYGVDRIAHQLNEEGEKTKRAKQNEKRKTKFRGADRWQRSTITCVLRNPVYMGTYVYGKTQGKIAEGREYRPNPKRELLNPNIKTAHKNRDFLPHEVVEIPVEAIITEEEWNRAQEQRTVRAERTIRHLSGGVNKYALPNLVRCAECERLMTRTTIKQPARKDGSHKQLGYYVCRNRDKACPNVHKHHRMDKIDAQVMLRLLPCIENPEILKVGLAELITKCDKLQARFKEKEERLTKRLSELQRKEEDALVAWSDGEISSENLAFLKRRWAEETARLIADKAEAQRKLREVEDELDLDRLEVMVEQLWALRAHLGPKHLADFTQWTLRASAGQLASGGGRRQKLRTAAAPADSTAPEDELSAEDLEAASAALDEYRASEATRDDYAESLWITVVSGLVKHVLVDRNSTIIGGVLRVPAAGFDFAQPGYGEEFSGECPENYTLNLNSITSPSETMYSLPSRRTRPFSLAAPFEPEVTRSS